jgi:hypothetical protein
MAQTTLRLGEGATCSVLVKYLRPSRDVKEAIPNPGPNHRVLDLVAVRREVTTRAGQTYDSVFFTSATLPGLSVSAAKRYVVVTAEGHEDTIWAPTVINQPAAVPATVPKRDELIGDSIFFAQNRAEDIARVRAEGFEVDDDNEPAPENIPVADAPMFTRLGGGLFEGQEWGWDRSPSNCRGRVRRAFLPTRMVPHRQDLPRDLHELLPDGVVFQMYFWRGRTFLSSIRQPPPFNLVNSFASWHPFDYGNVLGLDRR